MQVLAAATVAPRYVVEAVRQELVDPRARAAVDEAIREAWCHERGVAVFGYTCTRKRQHPRTGQGQRTAAGPQSGPGSQGRSARAGGAQPPAAGDGAAARPPWPAPSAARPAPPGSG